MLVVCEVVSLEGALHVVLINVLDALELVLFVALSRPFSLIPFVSSKVLEQLDERVVRHIVSRIYEALSLLLDVVLLVLLVVFVESLVLDRRAVGVRIEVVHIGEAHVAEVGFVLVVADVDRDAVAVVIRVVLGELGHFELGDLSFLVAEDRASDRDVVLVAVVVDVVERLVVLGELRSEELFDCFNSPDFNVPFFVPFVFIPAFVTHQGATDWDGHAQILRSYVVPHWPRLRLRADLSVGLLPREVVFVV